MEIIYCAAGNRRFAEIAVAAGMRYGAQLPGTIYPDVAPLYFADQDWKRPDRARYIAALAQHRPYMATVLDWERDEQLPEVLGWAEEIAPLVERIVIIPKVIGGVPRIPARVGECDVVLGYSVPTRYAGTSVPPWEFGRRPVHLLGGSPKAQLNAAHYLNVVSADGNYIQKMATKYCQYFVAGRAEWAANRHWPTLAEGNGGEKTNINDGHYEAFGRSCVNVMAAWHGLRAAA